MSAEVARPSSRVANRTGLSKIRGLTNVDGSDKESRLPINDMPSGWYFNENHQDSFWSDMEDFQSAELVSVIDKQDKQARCYNDLTTSSNRVNGILSRFDEIDQDMLMELVKVFDNSENIVEYDANSIISDTKTSVISAINELQSIAESQLGIYDALKSWFLSHRNASSIENEEQRELQAQTDETLNNLEKAIQAYTEKSEKAAFLHNDVNDFWTKQVVQLKKVVCQRDEEIHKLQETLDNIQNARNRKVKNKRDSTQNEAELKTKDIRIEQQMRTIQEQKTQIDKLRSALINSEVSKPIENTMSSKEVSKSTENIDLMNLTYESEARITQLNGRIEQLLSENEKSRQIANVDREKCIQLTKKLSEKDHEIHEMDIMLQKYIKMASLEKLKNQEPIARLHIAERDDSNLETLKCQQDVKMLKAKHKEELLSQAAVFEERLTKEKRAVLESMSSSDQTSAIKSIILDYESKSQKKNQEFKDTLDSYNSGWNSKLSYMAHQYERRIQDLLEFHEKEIISTRNSVLYETKKVELDLEENYQRDLLTMTQKTQELVSTTEQKNHKIEDMLFFYQKQNDLLKQSLQKFDPTSKLIYEQLPSLDSFMNPSRDLLVLNSIEKTMNRCLDNKSELESQHKWELEQQKLFYSVTINNQLFEFQENIRNCLITIIDSMDPSSPEKSISSIQEQVLQLLNTLNDQYSKIQVKSETSIPLSEASRRTTVLTERIIQLSNQNKELQSRLIASDKTAKDNYEEEYIQMKKHISYLESIQNGDSKIAVERLNEIEKSYKDQISFKDSLISEMQDLLMSNHSSSNVFENSIIFSRYVENNFVEEYEYEEEAIDEPSPHNVFSSAPVFQKENPFSDEVFEEEDSLEKHPKNYTTIVNSIEEDLVEEYPNIRTEKENEQPTTQKIDQDKIPESPEQYQTILNVDAALPGNMDTLKVIDKDHESFIIKQPRRKIKRIKSIKYSTSDATIPTSTYVSSIQSPQISTKVLPNVSEIEQNVNSSSNINAQPQVREQLKDKIKLVKKKMHYHIETQISLDQPIYEAALRAIVEHLGYARGDYFSILGDKVDFKVNIAPPKPKKTKYKDVSKIIFRRKLYMSHLSMQEIPDHFIYTDEPEPEIVASIPIENQNYTYTMIVSSLMSISPKPLPKPEPIIIAPDEEVLLRINDLQEQIKKMSQSNNLEESKKFREICFSQLKTAVCDHKERKIYSLSNRIVVLENKEPSVIVKEVPTIITVPSYINDDEFKGTTYENPQIKTKISKSIPGKFIDLPKTTERFVKGPEQSDSNDQERSIDDQQKTEISETPIAPISPFMVAEYKTRQPILFIMPPEQGYDDERIVDDPFSAAIQAMGSNMRFIAQLNDNHEEISNTLMYDYQAYEAFLTATGTETPSSAVFISNLKDVKNNIDQLLNAFRVYGRMQHSLLSLIRQSKKKSKLIFSKYSELKQKTESEKLYQQQKLLEIETGSNDSQQLVLERIGSAFQTLNQIDIELSIEESNTLDDLKYKLKSFSQSDEQIEQSVLDSFLISVQSFFAGIKPKSQVDIINNQSLMGEYDSAKSTIKSLQSEIRVMKIDINHHKEIISNLEDQNKVLLERFKEERIQSSQALSLYQSQITMLQQLLSHLKNDPSIQEKSSLELSNQIRQQFIVLQSLLNSEVLKNQNFHNRITDLEDSFAKKENECIIFKKRLEESEMVSLQSQSTLMKMNEANLFSNSQIEALKEEIAMQKEIIQNQREQLEKDHADISSQLIKLTQFEKENNEKSCELSKLSLLNEEIEVFNEVNTIIKSKIYNSIGVQMVFSSENNSFPDINKNDIQFEDNFRQTKPEEDHNNSDQVHRTFHIKSKFNPNIPINQTNKSLNATLTSSRSSQIPRPPSVSRVFAKPLPNFPSIKIKQLIGTQDNIPSVSRQSTISSPVKDVGKLPEDTLETIRITSVRYNHEKHNTVRESNISIMPEVFENLIVKTQPIQKIPEPDFEPFTRAIHILKKKQKELFDSINEKENIIGDLKKRITDFSIEIHRNRIDLIKEKEISKRFSIRYKEYESRLNTALDELTLREKSIMMMKKEIIRLRLVYSPAESSYRRLKKAQIEQQKLTHEQKIAQQILLETKDKLSVQQNNDTKSHLQKMIENTRQSIIRNETKKRMWSEMEKKHIMAALSALSLIQEENPISIRLPMLSTFRSMITTN